MSSLETVNGATNNIVALKRLGLFDPNAKKIFNCNVYQMSLILLSLFMECLIVYGLMGLFSGTENTMENSNLTDLLSLYQTNILCLVELFIFVYRADDIWQLYDVTSVNFLNSRLCCRQTKIFNKYRDVSVKIINFQSKFLLCALCMWVLYPQLSYYIAFIGRAKHGNSADIVPNKRFYNVFGIQYPVTIQTYNDYYYLFYLIESLIVIWMENIFKTFNTLFISFSYMLMAQYEMVAKAYETVGNEQINSDDHREMSVKGNENSYVETCISDFKLIVSDQEKLYRMLKMYYSVLWTFLIPSIITTSMGIIILMYRFVLICTSPRLRTFIDILKCLVTVFYILSNLFVVCYVVDNINIKKESVKFGMYSCNWTALNLKFKKLLLLSMQISNQHKSTVHISPKIIINLQFYANVLIRSYNVLSVMLKSYSRNKH